MTKVPIHEKIEWVPFCIIKSQYNMAGRRKMKIIVEHGTKEEREAQINRLKKYYELLYEMKEMSFESQWNCYREYAKDENKNIEIYKSFFDKAGSERKAIKATCGVIIEINECGDSIETEVSEKRQDIAHIWENIIQCIKKEADWEKGVYNQLNRAADNHPIITKAIIIVLSSILLGLVEDCIHDAIVMQNNETAIESMRDTIETEDESTK